jgi:hypothetical protein
MADFQEKVIQPKNLCFDFLYNFSKKHFILRIQQDIMINMHVYM